MRHILFVLNVETSGVGGVLLHRQVLAHAFCVLFLVECRLVRNSTAVMWNGLTAWKAGLCSVGLSVPSLHSAHPDSERACVVA